MVSKQADQTDEISGRYTTCPLCGSMIRIKENKVDTIKLSELQLAVLKLSAMGFTRKETADKLGIPAMRVRNIVHAIHYLLRVSTKVEMVREALHRGILTIGDL